MKPHKVLIAFAAASAALATAMSTATAKDELGAVTALQLTNTIAKSFVRNYLGAVNQAKGPVKIKYVGGQEVVPPRKAANALKRGQFDLLSCPTAYYIGTVPEGYALLAANQGPRALRANGAWEVLEEIYMKKAGAVLLAWGESMTSYNMYLAVLPKFRADGLPDLSGIKMRATGTYRPLFRALGASTINIKSSEVFTALQRGTVKGVGWPDVGLVPQGWQNLLKYRVTPNFYQTNQVLTINPGVWKSLTKAQQGFLKAQALEYETTSIHWLEGERAKEEKILHAAGVKDIALSGGTAERYLDLAHQEIWTQLKERSDYHDKLKPLMYIPGKPNRQVDIGRALRQ